MEFRNKFYLAKGRYRLIGRDEKMAKANRKLRIVFMPFLVVIWTFGWLLSSLGLKVQRQNNIVSCGIKEAI
jgi:hypothetical protein